jgi:hypothetical protein
MKCAQFAHQDEDEEEMAQELFEGSTAAYEKNQSDEEISVHDKNSERSEYAYFLYQFEKRGEAVTIFSQMIADESTSRADKDWAEGYLERMRK